MSEAPTRAEWEPLFARHPRYRQLVAEDPDTWRPILDGMLANGGMPVTPAAPSAHVALENEPAKPGFWTMGWNLVSSTVQHVAHGAPEVSETVQAARLAICRACPRFRPSDQSCSLCGCLMEIKTKWADMVCPDDPPRWLAES